MEAIQNYKVTITDMYDADFELSYMRHQYPSLMALIAHNYPEEFGECKGRGLCGTCHIKPTDGRLNDPLEVSEIKTLTNVFDTDTSSRLACQIALDDKINNMTFKIITE